MGENPLAILGWGQGEAVPFLLNQFLWPHCEFPFWVWGVGIVLEIERSRVRYAKPDVVFH